MWCQWSYQHSYELVVEACDRGDEPCCTNTTIAIDVLDVNDNQPVIQNINSSTECLSVLEVLLKCSALHTICDDVPVCLPPRPTAPTAVQALCRRWGMWCSP